jgi:hypothetical protein
VLWFLVPWRVTARCADCGASLTLSSRGDLVIVDLPADLPAETEQLPEGAYRCATCCGVYLPQKGPAILSCCVAHPPGSCCHYMETPVEVTP